MAEIAWTGPGAVAKFVAMAAGNQRQSALIALSARSCVAGLSASFRGGGVS